MSDKRIGVCDEELEVAYFETDVVSAMDYYTFGLWREGLEPSVLDFDPVFGHNFHLWTALKAYP